MKIATTYIPLSRQVWGTDFLLNWELGIGNWELVAHFK